MIFNYTNYCKYTWVILPVCLVLICARCGNKQLDAEELEGPGFFSTIYSDGILHTKLAVNMDSVMYHNDQESDREEKGTFKVDLGTSILEVPVEVRTRGVTRKKMCSFPPLRVQVKKDAVKENGWGDFRNYKLVTHCSDTLREQELLFREYLVYKMYGHLTDLGFRAQLLEMDYEFPNDTLHRYAVLLENEEELCSRLGLTALDIDKTKLTTIHFDHYKRFALFQYMLGNTDWNLGTGHNTKYVLTQGSTTPIVIPYDFDYSGFVNAPYAVPYETIPINNVRERYLMYRGKKSDDFEAIRDEFIAVKNEWLKMIDEFSLVSEEGREDLTAYINEFYTILEQPDWKDRIFPN